MSLHNYRSRQFHKTSNSVNPSISFRDMCSTKSGAHWCQIWQVLGPRASPNGANRQMTSALDNSIGLGMEKIRPADMICFRKVWQPPARHPDWYNTPQPCRLSSRLAIVFAQSIEARCYVENEDVVGAAPTGDAPTTSEWSKILWPIRSLTVCNMLSHWLRPCSYALRKYTENTGRPRA